jgi:16S rRNA (cytosine1402-N4)-methyltransferase
MVAEVKACFRLPISDDSSEIGGKSETFTIQRSLPAAGRVGEDPNPPHDAVFLDGTLGTGGHTLALLKAHPTCRVISFDRDADSMQFASRRLKEAGVRNRVLLVRGDFRRAPELLEESQKSEPFQTLFDNQEIEAKIARSGGWIDGALIDAGMSLYQVTWAERGLSFRQDAPLDMRYDRNGEISAFDLVNHLPADELEDLLFKFTDERWARRIVAFIVDRRNRSPIHSTLELAQLIEAAIPAGVRHQTRVHPATKTFAALRLAVNDEFWALEEGAWAISSVLSNKARLAVLTYSSNEDRVIKHTFRRLAGRPIEREQRSGGGRKKRSGALSGRHDLRNARSPLTFSLNLPYEDPNDPRLQSEWAQGFGTKWRMKIVTPKPIEPTAEEISANPLARSCKLRAVEKEMLSGFSE